MKFTLKFKVNGTLDVVALAIVAESPPNQVLEYLIEAPGNRSDKLGGFGADSAALRWPTRWKATPNIKY